MLIFATFLVPAIVGRMQYTVEDDGWHLPIANVVAGGCFAGGEFSTFSIRRVDLKAEHNSQFDLK